MRTTGKGVEAMDCGELLEFADDRERVAGVFDDLARGNASGWGEWYAAKADEACAQAARALVALHKAGLIGGGA